MKVLRRIKLGWEIIIWEVWWFFHKLLGKNTMPFAMVKGSTPYDTKIRRWRSSSGKVKRQMIQLTNLDLVEDVQKEVRSKWKYVLDKDLFNKGDYWETYKETIVNGLRGDCDGEAIHKEGVLRMTLRAADSQLLLIISVCGDSGHMFLGFVHPDLEEGDFYILDNGAYTRRMVKASELFPLKRKGEKVKLVCAFNRFTQWRFHD